MYRRKDSDRAIRVLQDQVDRFTDDINPDDPHRIFGDDILARVIVDSQMPVDIRTIDKGLLLWYNQAYIGMINKFEQTLEMVKDWDSINDIQEIESYDLDGKLKVPGHGIMHSYNNINQFRNTEYMDNLHLFKSIKTNQKKQQLETHNTPVTRDGKKHPIKMINTIYWDDDLVITEFHLLNP
tara:strand:- start:810 stop:1355 length:546 start_codon:yes stop_codon:yes gene_type:complete